jgi:hypothetical protein
MLTEHLTKTAHYGLTTTVAKEYVHRAALAEVFLTGWRRTAADAFTITAQWPRSHSFYSVSQAVYDPMLLCETIRQTFPLLMHAAYEVPFGYQLSWKDFRYTADPEAMRVTNAPAEIELRVRCHEIRRIRGLPSAMAMRFEITRGNALLAVASTRIGCSSPAVYQKVRAGRSGITPAAIGATRPQRPLAPHAVDRRFAADVVLAEPVRPSAGPPGSAQWQLLMDPTHPVLFDHPVDHAPGMVLFEAVQQAVLALSDQPDMNISTSMDMTFHRYVEFDSPCTIVAEPAANQAARPRRTIRVGGHQNGACAFEATVEADTFPLLPARDLRSEAIASTA